MMSAYCTLVDSGMGKARAFFAVLRACACLRAKSRRLSLEAVIMQRREVCQIKDTVMELIHHHLKRADRINDYIGKNQLVDELYRREHSSQFLNRAINELVRGGYIKIIPAKMIEQVYAKTPKRYVSKTQPLTALLTSMGVYARAVKEHQSYHQQKEYDV